VYVQSVLLNETLRFHRGAAATFLPISGVNVDGCPAVRQDEGQQQFKFNSVYFV